MANSSRHRPVTIRDIAKETCLSVTTVSVVLSGKADARGIAAETRARVLEAAGRLGYQHNGYARTLRTGRSNLIGIVGVDLDHPVPLMGVHHAARAVLQRGYSLSLHDLGWQQDEQARMLAELESRRIEGLLVVTGRIVRRARSVLERLSARGIPIVALDDWGVPDFDVVTVDRAEGAYLATRHLLALGHRRIVLTVPPNPTASVLQDRLRGYRRAHAEAGVPVDESLLLAPVEGIRDFQAGMELARRVLAHPARPTAMFCSNDRIAIGALRALYEAGKRVPDDLALVGFDGIEEAEFTPVPLTTVQQPMEEVACTAVSLLIERLNSGVADRQPRRIVLPPRLIVRRSCGA